MLQKDILFETNQRIKNIVAGVLGGIAGGVVFSLLLICPGLIFPTAFLKIILIGVGCGTVTGLLVGRTGNKNPVNPRIEEVKLFFEAAGIAFSALIVISIIWMINVILVFFLEVASRTTGTGGFLYAWGSFLAFFVT